MNVSAMIVDATTETRRGGFWRRALSSTIDTIVVMLPFQMLAAVLFAMTAGTVQMNGGFISCKAGENIPQSLVPVPPRDSNFMTVCRTSFFGATTGATLTVGRVTREGNMTTQVDQSYMLDKDGNPIAGTDIGLIFDLALLIYLVGMILKTGRTLGDRALGIRVIDTRSPEARGVPLGRAIVRYLAMFIGAVPALALWIYQYWVKGGIADEMFTGSFLQLYIYAAGIGLLWALVLVVQIAKKTDPIYDRFAGTAVVRV